MGVRWRIGTRERVVNDKDQWLQKSAPVVPTGVKEEGRGRNVQFLIDPQTRAWKEGLVKELSVRRRAN